MLSRRPKNRNRHLGPSVQGQEALSELWITAGASDGPRPASANDQVATFRKNVLPAPRANQRSPLTGSTDPSKGRADAHCSCISDNTFGTRGRRVLGATSRSTRVLRPRTFSIIDYVGGLQDLKDGLIRSIGDPNERFQEDPVRMLRAIVMASRLSFRLDPPIVDAIATHRALMATASPSRMIEEYYKILRSGYAEVTFRALAEHRLLDPVTPEIQRGAKNQGCGMVGRARRLPPQVRICARVRCANPILSAQCPSARPDAARRASSVRTGRAHDPRGRSR